MSNPGSRTDALLPGLVAWWTGIAGPVWSGPSPWATRASSLMAALAVLAGALLIHRFPRVGRGLGVGGFVGFSTMAWLAAPAGLLAHRLDPFVAGIAVVAWTVFAMGWGALELAVATAETDATNPTASDASSSPMPRPGSDAKARRPAPPHLELGWKRTGGAAVVTMGALGLILCALSVAERERGVLAEITAGAAALAVVAVLGTAVRPATRGVRTAKPAAGSGRKTTRFPASVLACLVFGLVVLVVLFTRDG